MRNQNFDAYSVYRKQVEKIAANYFLEKRESGKDYSVQDKYPYILKNSNEWNKNIIQDNVVKNIKALKAKAKDDINPFPLHKYLHHGLSSQAMLFNLFGDALINNDYAFFQDVFQFQDIQIDNKYKLKFEHSERKTFNENQQQPTSFDFAVYDKTGVNKSVFVEAKYVETEFGGCSAIKGGECDGLNPLSNSDLCYLKHKGRNYWELMKKYDLDVAYKNSPICPFVIYYQFYRELMFALENNGYFVILIDKRNPAFERYTDIGKRGLIPILLNQIPSELQKEIKIIYIQDVLPVLEKYGYRWVGKFREKYGMI
ncbi:MAG: PGN_0703 family putative restriction endonuclease [Bacteroidales bacterium]